jgi:biopolymer transport protein ExbD
VRAARREPGIEITPLIDVVFLLLIFFMVSSNFVQNRVIHVSLPESDSALAGSGEILQITVTAAGDYWVAGQDLGRDIESLAAAVDDYARVLTVDQLAAQSVEIRADANATHQSVIRVFDVCASAGFVQVSLTTAMSAQTSEFAPSQNSDPNQ